jgi:hypothetical protein
LHLDYEGKQHIIPPSSEADSCCSSYCERLLRGSDGKSVHPTLSTL